MVLMILDYSLKSQGDISGLKAGVSLVVLLIADLVCRLKIFACCFLGESDSIPVITTQKQFFCESFPWRL